MSAPPADASAVHRDGSAVSHDAASPHVAVAVAVHARSAIPVVRAVAPTVGPSFSPEAIRRVVRRHRAEVDQCRASVGTHAASAAPFRLRVRFVIGHDGAVLDARAEEPPPPLVSLGECVSARVRTWRFPAPMGGGPLTITFPFEFAAAPRPAR